MGNGRAWCPMGNAEGAGEVFEMLLLLNGSVGASRRRGVREWCCFSARSGMTCGGVCVAPNFGRPRSFGSLHSLQIHGARWTACRWVGEELRSALGVVMHWSSFARRCGLSDRLIHTVSLRRDPARSSGDLCRIGPASFCFPAWSPARDHESLYRSIIRSDPGRRHCEACPKVAQLQDGEAGQAMGAKWCVDVKSSSREHIDQAGRKKSRRVTSQLKACNACNNGSTRSRDVSSVCPTSVAQ